MMTLLNMNKTKRNFIGWLTLFTLLLGVGGGWLLHTCSPEHYFTMYPIVPLFFYLSGLVTITLFDFFRARMPQRLLMLYMGIRVFRMMFTIILVLVYCILFRESVRPFIVTLVLFYLLYLTYETSFFFRYELKGATKKK